MANEVSGQRPMLKGTIQRNLPLSAAFALLLGLGGGCVKPAERKPVPADPAAVTPLSQVPFLMAHDAATTYRRHYSLLGKVLPGQVQTQPEGGFTDLLDCGVRAFDLRPCRAHDGQLFMHHGPVTIKYPLGEALEEIINWAGRHHEALVIVYLSHCGAGEGCATGAKAREQCESQTANLLEKLGITLIQSVDMTLEEAVKKAKLPNGGLVLALDQFSQDSLDQVRENYDPSIQYCAGRKVKPGAVTDLFAYMDRIAAEKPSGRELVISQAHWQDPHSTFVDGCHETVLQMESGSEINKKVAEEISRGRWRHINLLEVDNACDRGPELKTAIDNHFARQISGERR